MPATHRGRISNKARHIGVAGVVMMTAAFTFTSATTATAQVAGSPAALNGTYVALGDSYAAGPGIPNQESNSSLCARSDHNYPNLVAQAISPTAFTDVTCSGATTDDMTGSQLGAAAQFDALSANDKLVTVTIGGNDAGFAGVVITCVVLYLFDPTGSPCKDHYTSGGTDQIAATIAQVTPKIAATLDGIHQRAPQARVLIVGYPDITPNSQSQCTVSQPLATGDYAYLNGEEQLLNHMLAVQAANHDATYVDTYTPSIGHDACQAPGVRWIEGLTDIQNSIPVHPNAIGHQAMANEILAALG